MDDIIGVDVSKDRLDVHRLTGGSNSQFSNGTTGHSKLLKWLETLPSLPLVIYEATGTYYRQLELRLGGISDPEGRIGGQNTSPQPAVSPFVRPVC